MFYIFDNAVYPEKSDILFHDDFSGKVGDNWEVAGGGWTIKDGVLLGCIRENRGGLIYSHMQYPGDIMLDFYGTLVSPCKNDLNFTFRASGWDKFNNDADTSYIGGLGGWWTGKAGIEKYPDCRLQALTGAFQPESGREYRIQAGIIGDRCFLAVDGAVIVEMRDPEPICHPGSNRVGLGVYCSKAQFRDFKVLRPKYEHQKLCYPLPEF